MTTNEQYLAEVPYKGNGESVRFFSEHMELKGQSIPYEDIAFLSSNGSSTVHTFIGIPLGRSFDGGVVLKMNNGKTHSINMNSMSMFGIPIIRNPRKNEKLFPALFSAVNSIVAKAMAQKHIDAINVGNTVEVAGLVINSLEAKPKSSKKAVIINRDNYRDSLLTSGTSVGVYDGNGDLIWGSSIWDYKNILLIPYILDAIFG